MYNFPQLWSFLCNSVVFNLSNCSFACARVCVYPDYGGQSSRGKWYLIRIHPISLHTAQDLSSIQYYECIISLCVCALLIRVYVFTQCLCVCHSQCA